MTKYHTKIDFSVFFTFLILCLADLGLLILYAISGVWLPALLVSVLLFFFVFPLFFFTNYTLTEKSLKINSGWWRINFTISYTDILAITPTKKFAIAPKLSRKAIKIVYLHNQKTRCVRISPALFNTFIDQLSESVLHSVVAKDSAQMEVKEKQNTKSIKQEKTKA